MLVLRCTLLLGVFEGGARDDPRSPEWPPSWMRLYSALVSVAEPGSDDDALLRTLEAADPPQIRASLAALTRRRSFVPTNAAPKVSGHTSLPGRTNGERHWARAIPESPVVWYRWPGLELSDREQQTLTTLVRKVPYLGRATSPTLVEVSKEAAPEDGWIVPRDRDELAFEITATVRAPFPGALAALRDAHEEKFVHGGAGDPGQIGRGITYGTIGSASDAGTDTGPYEHLIILRLVDGTDARRAGSLDGRHTARVAHAIRRALMSRAGADGSTLPAALHGHHDGSVRQVAFLGLVNVGTEHADGRLLGIGLAVPKLARQDLQVVLSAIPKSTEPHELLTVDAGPLGQLLFERLSTFDATDRFSLSVDRWRGPARRWATATPAVLDRFMKRGMNLEQEVRRCVEHAGLPQPTFVEVSRDPFVPGGLTLTARDTLRRPEDRGIKPYRHVRLEFARPLLGPVAIGSMRNYGLGVCVPVRHRRSSDGS